MKKLFLFVIGLVLFLSGCSSKKENLEVWTTFDGKTVYLPQIGDNQARVFFYREDDLSIPPVKIFVEGDYLTSLLRNSYKPANICSVGDLLSLGFTNKIKFVNRYIGNRYTFDVGKTHYMKVVLNNKKQPIFKRMTEKEGQKAISNLREITHTLSRVKNDRVCDEVVLEKIVLGSHLLFKFNKSSYESLLPQGKQEIKRIIEKINSEKSNITGIKVIGYTDPMGSRAYNYKLSTRRAKAVKSALKISDKKINIEYQGLGENNLVVKNCLAKFRKNRAKRIRCDQVNRRVEIILYGNSKK